MDEIQSGGPVEEGTLVCLIKRAQRDFDPQAFDGLYLLFAERVFRYLQARLADADLAEEVTAQVFVRLIEKIHLYQLTPKDNVAVFSAWLYKMAHNKMVDVLRAQKRREQVAREHAYHVTTHYTADNSIGRVEDKLDLEEILNKLQYLNETQRAVIVLRFIENLTIAETAQTLQKSEAAIKSLQQRALESLRSYLNL